MGTVWPAAYDIGCGELRERRLEGAEVTPRRCTGDASAVAAHRGGVAVVGLTARSRLLLTARVD
jgi:hypothetical protein